MSVSLASIQNEKSPAPILVACSLVAGSFLTLLLRLRQVVELGRLESDHPAFAEGHRPNTR